MTQIDVVIDRHVLIVALDVDNAPGLTSAVLRALPHSSLAVHCQTAGAEFCVPVPFFHWHENRRVPLPGDVGYASFGNYLCFYYGPMAAMDGPTNVIGSLRSSPLVSEALGSHLLHTGAQKADVRIHARLDQQPAPLPQLTLPTTTLALMSRRLLEAALANPPDDIAHLRHVPLPAMGNVAARLQASVLLLALAEVLMNARTLAPDFSTSLPTVIAGLVAQMARYSRWLAMAGLPATAAWIERTCEVLRDEPITAGELVAGVEEALVAIGRLRFWAEAVSPWHKVANDYASESVWINPALPR